MSQRTEVPLKWPRAFAYAMTWALSFVAACATLNSIVKGYRTLRRDVRLAEAASPVPGVVLHASISDIISAGAFLGAGEILFAFISHISFATLFPWALPGIGGSVQRAIVGKSPPSSNTRNHWSRGWKVLMAWWIFCFVWSLCSAAVSLDWALHRSGKVNAYLNGVELPASIIQGIQQELGIKGNYWASGFTRFFAISCWPMLAFALLSILLSVFALSGAPVTQHVDEPSPAVNEKELG